MDRLVAVCLVLTPLIGTCECWSPDDLPSTPGRHLFVSAGDPAADDENPGTWDRPCRTITRAAELTGPGDTVWVRGGVYREVVQVRTSGEGPGRMISFRAMPGEQPVVKGSEVLSGWVRSAFEPDRAVYETDWPFPNVFPSMVCADDAPLVPCSFPPDTEALKPPATYCRYLLGFGRGQADMTPGSFCYDEQRGKLLVWLKGNADPGSKLMEAALRACCWDSQANYVLVEGLRIRQCALVRPYGGVAFVMTGPGGGGNPAEGCIVRNCEVSLSAFEGMVVRGGRRDTTVVVDCWVHHNGNGCGGFEGQGEPGTDSWVVVQRCRLTDNNLFNWNPSWHAGGKHFGNRVLFDRCEFSRQYNSPGLWFDCKARDMVVNRCYAGQSGLFGLYYEIGETGALLNNVVEGSPHCCAIALNGSSRCLVANNLVSATERGIVAGWEGNAEGQVARVTCYNAIVSNIVLGHSYPLISISPEREVATGNTSDHNLLWQRPPAPWQTPGSGGYFESGLGDALSLDLAGWQALRRLDLASRVADPMVELANGQFRRSADSPSWSGGERLDLGRVREIFALRPMPAVQSDVGSASISDHKPASEAFLRKVSELLSVPEGQDMPVGPVPDPREGEVALLALSSPGFEVPRLEPGASSDGAAGWHAEGGPVRIWHARATGQWNWNPPSGDNVLVLAGGQSEALAVSQALPAPMAAGVRYRLSAWFGQRVDQADSPWPKVTMRLLAGPRLLGTVDVPEPSIRPHLGVWVQTVLVVEPWDGLVPRDDLRVVVQRTGATKVDVCIDDVELMGER